MNEKIDHSQEAEKSCSTLLFGRAELGSPQYEKMIDFMRADLNSGMALSKIEVTARKLLAEQGRDFDAEFEKWRKERDVK